MGQPESGSFTVKEIVVEIRDAVKDLAQKVDKIDREGPIGLRAELVDHSDRLRRSEERLGRLEEGRVTREDLHKVKGDVAGINLRLAESGALEAARGVRANLRAMTVPGFVSAFVSASAAVAAHFWK